MADSVYISKNLSEEQLRFMQELDAHEVLYFQMKDIEAQLDYHTRHLNEVLENLVDKRLLQRIEKGKYARADFNDLNALACFLAGNGTIAYWSALHYHGLTERFPNTTFIKTSRRKQDTILLGSKVKYVSVLSIRSKTGRESVGFGQRSFEVTDVEMTLVDCMDQLRYAGDWPDLLRAIDTAKINSNKLIEYCTVYKNTALIKRMGYLCELYDKTETQGFIKWARKQVNTKYNLVYAQGREEGEFNAQWKLRLNIPEEVLREAAKSEY